MRRIDGTELARKIRKEIEEEVQFLKEKNVVPGLAVILVGHDPASQLYVNSKEKACETVGINSKKYLFDENVSEQELLELIGQLNKDQNIDGILVQLPLPNHINENVIIDAIDTGKDVDGFSPTNVGQLVIGNTAFEPCTPKGCMALLREAGIKLAGKKAVVIGRSNIVGKPMALLLLSADATVTICHSHTKNLREEIADADIVVLAVGKEKFLTPDMVKDGVVIIDVGINRDEKGKVCGDADFSAFEEINKDCAITPVPGGVGPMTITMLLKNTLISAKRRYS